MNKKLYSCLSLMLVLITMLLPLTAVTARADVIWEPEDNFYRRHAEECDYVNRSYYANGESGYMEIAKEPGGRSLGFAENGALFHVQFSYKQGNDAWGYVEFSKTGERLTPRSSNSAQGGWARLSDMLLKFDAESFDALHAEEYEDYAGRPEELKGLEKLVIWTFPNSGENFGLFENFDDSVFEVSHIYTDPAGLRWGNFSYLYGWRNVWVCLDKPDDMNLAAKDVPVPEFYSPDPGFVPKPAQNELTIGVVVGVSAVVLLSALLLALRKKMQKGQ